MAIDRCKKMIMSAENQSDQKKLLVKKLVQLRLKFQQIKVIFFFHPNK